jgi:hypothetical protein
MLARHGITPEEAASFEKSIDQMLRMRQAGAGDSLEQVEMVEAFGRAGLKFAAIQKAINDMGKDRYTLTQQEAEGVERMERGWKLINLHMENIAAKAIAHPGLMAKWWGLGALGGPFLGPLLALKGFTEEVAMRNQSAGARRASDGGLIGFGIGMAAGTTQDRARRRQFRNKEEEEDQFKLAELRMQNQEADYQKNFHEMQPGRQRDELRRQLELLKEEEAGYPGSDTSSKIARERIHTARSQLEGQLFQLNQVHGLSAPADALRRVGLSTGPGGGNPLVELSRQQVGFLRELVVIARSRSNGLPVNTTGA